MRMHHAEVRMAFSWIYLNEAVTRLMEKYSSLGVIRAHEIVENAVKSGKTFVRGITPGKTSHETIGERVKHDTPVDIFLSSVGDYRQERWTQVQVQWEQFIIYVEHNLLPSWVEVSSGPYDYSLRSDDELAAVRFLAEHLQADPDMKREDALSACRNEFPALSERGFRTRIWPQARQSAGLEAVAPPGRKSKR
jgi:hypothetical protein